MLGHQRGPLIVTLTVASYFLNAVFAFAISQPDSDKLSTSVVRGALSAIVCTPPCILGRLGILMLGSSLLFIPGTSCSPLESRCKPGQPEPSERQK